MGGSIFIKWRFDDVPIPVPLAGLSKKLQIKWAVSDRTTYSWFL